MFLYISFCACFSKSPQASLLKAAHIYTLRILELRNPKSVLLGQSATIIIWAEQLVYAENRIKCLRNFRKPG